MADYQLITQPQQLATACEHFAQHDFVAIDTEFMREDTYFPKLALVQLSDGEHTVCIDPLACGDLSPLWILLKDQSVVKVFHSARQDLELFYHDMGEVPAPLYDTQVAAPLLGHPEQMGYGPLIQAALNIELDKSQSRTDWLKRPLSEAQLSYAAADVYPLAELYRQQREQLENLGRLSWLDEDFAELGDAKLYKPDPAMAWKKVKGAQRLKPAQLAIVKTVAAWREELAVAENRPRRRVLKDDVIIDMARLKPRDLSALSELRGIHPPIIKRHGEALLTAIEKGLNLDRAEWPSVPRKKGLKPNQDASLDALQAVVKLIAMEQEIAANTLATRKDLESLVRQDEDSPLKHGWRKSMVYEKLKPFLEGSQQLTLEQGVLTLSSR